MKHSKLMGQIVHYIGPSRTEIDVNCISTLDQYVLLDVLKRKIC